MRVTHPFHPLSGQQLACVGERFNRYGKRLLLRVDDANVCSVPPQWTDVVAADAEIVMGNASALLRMTDWIDLARLVARLACTSRHASAPAEGVSKNMPHVYPKLRRYQEAGR